ncbi:MAG: hypothetical protein ACO33A_01400 [Hyphomonas sp.]
MRTVSAAGWLPQSCISTLVGAFLAVILMTGLTPVAVAQNDTTLRITGQGETSYEARQDAIRQALQIAVDQLVVSQQVVENDRLTLDRISSTMNGFVSGFMPIRSFSENGSVFIEADIIVSQSRIENFIGLTNGARTEVNSDNILASMQAERLARTARAEMVAALFRDFPARALEAGPVSFSLNQVDPSLVDFSTEVRWAPGFLRSLEEGLNALGARHINCRRDPYSCGAGYPPNSLMVCLMHGDWRFSSGSSSLRPVSLGSTKADCYMLAPVDLSVLGAPQNGEGGLARFACIAGVCVPGNFAAALTEGGRLIDIGYSQSGFLAGWELRQYPQPEASAHLTVLLDTRPVVINASLPAGRLEGVRAVDTIPLVAYLEHDPPGWGISYSERMSLTRSDPANVAFVTSLFPKVNLVRHTNAQSHVNDLLREYVPAGN